MSCCNSNSQLVVNGGAKLREAPWPQRGLIGPEEKAAVDALFDDAISTGTAIMYDGPAEMAYCEEFAQVLGGGWADAVNSGSSAVYVALKALNLEPFTEVICGPITDPGGMMPIAMLNCIPIVPDAAPGTWSTGPEQVEAVLSPRTSAIIVTHIAGEPADVAGIMEIANARGIPVIEDCAQAHIATLHGQPVGTFGAIGAFSTMFGKHFSTGGQGGMVFTRDEDMYWRIRRASDRGKPHGLTNTHANVTATLNLNLNDLSATLGRVQLKKLPAIVSARRAVVAALARETEGLTTVSVPTPLPGAEPSYWFLRTEFHPENATCDKATYCAALGAEGLPILANYRCMPQAYDW